MKFFKSIVVLALISTAANADFSYDCLFTKKVSYSSMRDTTPNRIRHVSMGVIYRVVGDELLTRPDGVHRTYSARLRGKWLDRFGDLYYIYKSRSGYTYGFSADRRDVIEMTASGKTVLYGTCEPIY
jgi:signal peptidase I